MLLAFDTVVNNFFSEEKGITTNEYRVYDTGLLRRILTNDGIAVEWNKKRGHLQIDIPALHPVLVTFIFEHMGGLVIKNIYQLTWNEWGDFFIKEGLMNKKTVAKVHGLSHILLTNIKYINKMNEDAKIFIYGGQTKFDNLTAYSIPALTFDDLSGVC